MEKTNVSQPSEQYASFGLGRRNVFMWLASLFMLLSGALRIVYYSSPVEDAEGVGSTAFVLFLSFCRSCSAFWYAAALISKGSERLFTTCTPVFFGTAFLIYRACILFKSGAFGFNSGILLAANIIFCCMLYFIYRFAVNTGAKRAKAVAARRYIALIAFAAAAAIVFWQSGLLNIFRQPEGGITSFLGGISLFCAALAVILVFIGAKLNSDNMPLPACGDRSDGRRLRSLDPISGVGVYIMSRRNGAIFSGTVSNAPRRKNTFAKNVKKGLTNSAIRTCCLPHTSAPYPNAPQSTASSRDTGSTHATERSSSAWQ